MINAAVRTARRFASEQRWSNVVATRLLRGFPDRPPELITDFASGPVVVIAPHMDDETIGCGGALLRHRRAGVPVTVVFLTDGSRGNAQGRHDPELPDTRKQEAWRAAEVLGGLQLHFLDLPDGEVSPDRATIARIADQLAAVKAAIVYLPTILDTHRDHRAACIATSRALGCLPDTTICREYEVWAPLMPNRIADISDVFETKIAALKCHESQVRCLDYVAVTRGLAMYRTMHGLHGRGAAEAFCDFSIATHRRLVRRLGDWHS